MKVKDLLVPVLLSLRPELLHLHGHLLFTAEHRLSAPPGHKLMLLVDQNYSYTTNLLLPH